MKPYKFIKGSFITILLLAAVILFQSQTTTDRKPAQWNYITFHAQMGADPSVSMFPNGVLNKINNEGYELTDIFTIANDPSLPPYQSNVLFVLRKRSN